MIAGYNTLKIVSPAVWKELEVIAKSADFLEPEICLKLISNFV
jgi:hypothetical protein